MNKILIDILCIAISIGLPYLIACIYLQKRRVGELIHIKNFEYKQKPYESVSFECPNCFHKIRFDSDSQKGIPYGKNEHMCPNCGCKFILSIPKK